jgi:hypothetical protein
MTIRVREVDHTGREIAAYRAVHVDPSPPPAPVTIAYPPCACTLCTMTLTASVPGCERCAELETAGRDPRLRLTLGSLYLSRLVDHHIDVHDAPGIHADGCEACERWNAGGWGVASHLAALWSRRHFVQHHLGLIWDGPGHPLRFADMPPMDQPHPSVRAVRP